MDWWRLNWESSSKIYRSVTISGSADDRQSKLITKCAVEFDTLVADLFVPSVNCPTCSNENLYDVKSSSTGVDQNQAVNVIFDFDTVTGEIVTDVISVGEFEVSRGAYWSYTDG